MLKTLDNYENSIRCTGRTTKLIEKAKETGAIIVCHSSHMTNEIAHIAPDVKAIMLKTYNDSTYHYGRRQQKYLFDNAAVYVMIRDKLNEVNDIINA